jgi:hypothetical protein
MSTGKRREEDLAELKVMIAEATTSLQAPPPPLPSVPHPSLKAVHLSSGTNNASPK